jgi:hypothetical protein
MTTAQIFSKIFTWLGYGLMGLAALGALFVLAVNVYSYIDDLKHGRAEGWEIIWVLGAVVLLGGIAAGIGYGLLALGRKLGG